MAKSSFTVDVSGSEHLEAWLPIPGFEGYYEASNLGRVRGVDRLVDCKGGGKMRRRGQLLSQRLLDNGYAIVMMSKLGQYQNQSVHRLVLKAFCGEPLDGQECCHLNGVRNDNRLENLRWDTKSSNTLDQVTHGTHHHARVTHCPLGHEYTPENTYIHPQGSRICRICKRIRDSAAYQKRSPNYGIGETHCRNGHERTADNTYLHKGSRLCKTCRHESYLRSKANHK